MIAQEIKLLEVFEPETRSTRRVDLNGAPIPSALGFAHAAFAGAGTAAGSGMAVACGAAALLAPAVCDHAELEATSESAPATTSPVPKRILFPLRSIRAKGSPVWCERLLRR